MAAHRSWECHSVYWEMISVLPDRITLQSLHLRSPVMEDDQSLKWLSIQEELKLYSIYESLCVNVKQCCDGESCEKAHLTHGRYCILEVGENLTFYLRLYSLCLYLLPAVPQLERRLNGGHLYLKDFSHFLSIEKSSSRNALLLFSPSPAERLGGWFVYCVEVRGHKCVLQLLSVTLKLNFCIWGTYCKQEFACSCELRVWCRVKGCRWHEMHSQNPILI